MLGIFKRDGFGDLTTILTPTGMWRQSKDKLVTLGSAP